MKRALPALNWLCHLLLGLGLVAPCLTLEKHVGPVPDSWARWMGLIDGPTTFSIGSTIVKLFDQGEALIGAVILLFSVIFPTAKLIVTRLALKAAAKGEHPAKLFHLAAAVSKFSMVDVFVIALMVVVGKAMPGGSRMLLEWGTYAFAAAALLSTVVMALTKRLFQDPVVDSRLETQEGLQRPLPDS